MPMLTAQKQQDLQFVLSKIRQYLPRLIEFLDDDRKLKDYSRDLYDYQAPEIHLQRQKPCLDFINQKTKRLFPDKQIEFNTKNGIIANVVDHHNILNHPLLTSGIIISNIYQFNDSQQKKDNILVLSCGSVPFSNNFHKRGFSFNNITFPFVKGKDTDRVIHFFPSKKLEFLPLAQERGMLNELNAEQMKFLKDYQQTILDVNADKYSNFLDQMSVLNHKLFPLLFEKSLRNKLPELVYIETEEMAAHVLKQVIKEKNNFIHDALFNPKFRHDVLNGFEGIWGAWDKQQNLGSHFFFLEDGKGGEVALEYMDGYLVSKSKKLDVKIKLDPETILDLLKKNKIRPSIFLFYGITLFYCGIKPLTGLGSMNYLSDMQSAWIKVLSEYDSKEAEMVKNMNMRGLIVSPNVLYARNADNQIIEQFFADVVYSGGLNQDYLNHLAEMKFNHLLKTSLIGNYEIKTPQAEKKELNLTVNDLVSEGFGWIK
ncbi:MAG: hypothetical protein ACOYUZ_03430 [Patescibacteria group bacterium]